MSIQALFPSLVYTAALKATGARAFNRELLKEAQQIRAADQAGQRWSVRRYPGGYTSYGSLCHLHKMSSTFATLEQALKPHVRSYVRSLALDMGGRSLSMTDCWVNVMARQGVHGLHLHPLATISGTYYVQTPPGCAPLKLEDPRLDRLMAAPPKRRSAPAAHQPWVTLRAKAGHVVLFESWLRHEVPPHTVAGERVSISFNYHWL